MAASGQLQGGVGKPGRGSATFEAESRDPGGGHDSSRGGSARLGEGGKAHTAAGPRSLDPPLPGLAFLNSSPLCRSERRSLLLETARRLV